jgi:hypothetical protein
MEGQAELERNFGANLQHPKVPDTDNSKRPTINPQLSSTSGAEARSTTSFCAIDLLQIPTCLATVC